MRVYLGLYLIMTMRCAAIAGDTAALQHAARRLAAQAELGSGWLSEHQMAGAAAHLSDTAGDLADACTRWRALLAHADRSDIFGQVVEAALRLADALWRRGRPAAEAAAALQPAWERVDAEGERGAALMAGPALLARLAERPWGAALASARAAQLLHWARTAQALLDAPAATAARSLPAAPAPGLSAREAEVLARIAAGDSNKLIARAFDLSPHTVKRHVANILEKLGLASRGQAAAWYREHG